jgi:hypothetical protein
VSTANLVRLAVLLTVAVTTAVILFIYTACNPFTLVLQAKSLERGKCVIVATDQHGSQSRIPFELGGESGESAVYTVELPRKQLTTIAIPPLAATGRFEIERITLRNSAITFSWDGSSECRSRRESDPIGHYSPCSPDSPRVNSVNDTISLTDIPLAGVNKSLSERVFAAILVGVLIFFAGAYLLREAATGTAKIETYLERSGWLLVTALFLWQLLMLWRYSVDLPFWEEWEFFEPYALQRGLTFDWLFQHFGTNQQVVVFTKLMAWLDFKLFNLDFARLKLMNYLVFGGFLVVLVRFARQVSGEFRLLPYFVLFLVSPLAYEAHAASFQSGEIFVLLFTVLMLCHAAPERPGLTESLLFAAAALGAVFSMHTGVAAAGILLASRTAFILDRILAKEVDRRAAVSGLFVSWLIILAGGGYWLSGFDRAAVATVKRLMPTDWRFWEQFLNLLSFGFGFDADTPIPGSIILIFLLAPLLLLLLNKATRRQQSTWQILPAILVLLALAAMITFGRGGMFTTLKLSRYTVYLTPLIPFGALAWWLVCRERRAFIGVFALPWVFCFAAFSNNWSYGIYRELRQMDLQTLECVEAYNSGKGDGSCPDTHGVPIGGFFDNARKLNISFTRQFVRPDQPK